MDGGLVGVGDCFFVAAEAFDVGGELGPFGAFDGKEKFVDVAESVFAAAEGGFDFLGNGEGARLRRWVCLAGHRRWRAGP